MSEAICDAAIKQGPSIVEAAALRGSSVLHPATWLNQQRFLDEDFGKDMPVARLNGNNFVDEEARRNMIASRNALARAKAEGLA